MDALLPFLRRPSRYLGSELNAACRPWDDAEVRTCFVFPDLYEIGMSHQGLQILYRIVNRHPRFLADRQYAPDLDAEQQLRQRGAPLCGLESRRPLDSFDVIGITLPYELCYVNILTILDLAGLPLRAAERGESHPLVIGGGPCAFNPEPVADFFDLFLLGDGEEAVIEILDAVAAAKRERLTRRLLLERLALLPGCYAPSLFAPRYGEQGRVQEITPLVPGYESVTRRLIADLDQTPTSHPPLVPFAPIVHDRLGIEIARGCTRGCRFCQAGVIYRPVRERSPARVLELARSGLRATGFDEVALLSLSTGDYSCLEGVLTALMDQHSRDQVSVSLPSMRVGTLTGDLMRQIKRVRKTGFTLAPEAGTDRLRQVINKGITEEDLLAACTTAFSLGWRLIKLYFMVGLPFEAGADVEAIPALVNRIGRQVGAGSAKRQVNASVATYVPKAHTVFQWEPQLPLDEAEERIGFLKNAFRRQGVKLKWHEPRQSLLEGVFARGDRRLSVLIEAVWRLGGRLDAWTDHFDFERWQQAAAACGIDLQWYLRRRDPAEILPWHHLRVGMTPEFLRAEQVKAASGQYTPDCRVHGCQGCGVCDFDRIQPITFGGSMPPSRELATPGCDPTAEQSAGPEPDVPRSYRLSYTVLGHARFLGHLEMMQVFFRAFRRLALPLRYSQGFSPTPRVSFSPARPVGTESLAEYIDIDCRRPLVDHAEFLVALNRELPAGVEALRLTELDKPPEPEQTARYRVALGRPIAAAELRPFLDQESFMMTRARKGKESRIDARPLVSDLASTAEGEVVLAICCAPGKAAVKPIELLTALLGLSDDEQARARIIKVS